MAPLFKVLKTSLVVGITSATMLSLIACTRSKDDSGSSVITDGTKKEIENTNLNMSHNLNNGNLTIFNKLGQQVGQATNVTRMIGQATENFIAYEVQSPKMGLIRTIFHSTKGNVAHCERNCRITLRKNFASFKIRQRKKNLSVGLIDKNGNSYNYASRIDRNGKMIPVKLQIGNDFALLTRSNGEKSLINSEQGMISNAKNIRVQGSFAVATIGRKSYLFNSNNSFQLNSQRDRLNGVIIKSHFAIVDYGVYKRIYHATKGLIVDSCNNCHVYGAENAPRGVDVGNRDILVSNNFILIPNNSNNGRSRIYNKDNQALTEALPSGTRVKINNFFAGYSGQRRSQLFHVHNNRSIMDTGYSARIRLLENGARFITPIEKIVFDNSGKVVNRKRN